MLILTSNTQSLMSALFFPMNTYLAVQSTKHGKFTREVEHMYAMQLHLVQNTTSMQSSVSL